MNYYLLLNGEVLSEIIPDEVELFPGVPAVERYAPELLGKCVVRACLEGVEVGMSYARETDLFYWPEPLPMPEPIDPPATAEREGTE